MSTFLLEIKRKTNNFNLLPVYLFFFFLQYISYYWLFFITFFVVSTIEFKEVLEKKEIIVCQENCLWADKVKLIAFLVVGLILLFINVFFFLTFAYTVVRYNAFGSNSKIIINTDALEQLKRNRLLMAINSFAILLTFVKGAPHTNIDMPSLHQEVINTPRHSITSSAIRKPFIHDVQNNMIKPYASFMDDAIAFAKQLPEKQRLSFINQINKEIVASFGNVKPKGDLIQEELPFYISKKLDEKHQEILEITPKVKTGSLTIPYPYFERVLGKEANAELWFPIEKQLKAGEIFSFEVEGKHYEISASKILTNLVNPSLSVASVYHLPLEQQIAYLSQDVSAEKYHIFKGYPSLMNFEDKEGILKHNPCRLSELVVLNNFKQFDVIDSWDFIPKGQSGDLLMTSFPFGLERVRADIKVVYFSQNIEHTLSVCKKLYKSEFSNNLDVLIFDLSTFYFSNIDLTNENEFSHLESKVYEAFRGERFKEKSILLVYPNVHPKVVKL